MRCARPWAHLAGQHSQTLSLLLRCLVEHLTSLRGLQSPRLIAGSQAMVSRSAFPSNLWGFRLYWGSAQSGRVLVFFSMTFQPQNQVISPLVLPFLLIPAGQNSPSPPHLFFLWKKMFMSRCTVPLLMVLAVCKVLQHFGS